MSKIKKMFGFLLLTVGAIAMGVLWTSVALWSQPGIIDGHGIQEVEILNWEGTMAFDPSVSSSGEAKMYFNTLSGKVRVSEDGGAWQDLVIAGAMLTSVYDADEDSLVDQTAGGLEADVSAFTGLIGLNAGTVTEVDTEAELESALGFEILVPSEVTSDSIIEGDTSVEAIDTGSDGNVVLKADNVLMGDWDYVSRTNKQYIDGSKYFGMWYQAAGAGIDYFRIFGSADSLQSELNNDDYSAGSDTQLILRQRRGSGPPAPYNSVRFVLEQADYTFDVDFGYNSSGYTWTDALEFDIENQTLAINGDTSIGRDGKDGQLTIYSEQGDTDYAVILQPNVAMTESTTYVLPAAQSTGAQFLQNDGSGNLTWAASSVAEADTLDTVADRGATTDKALTVGGINLADGLYAYFGTGNDGMIYSTSDNLIIRNQTADKDIQFIVKDGGVDKNIMTINADVPQVIVGGTTGNAFEAFIVEDTSESIGFFVSESVHRVGLVTRTADLELAATGNNSVHIGTNGTIDHMTIEGDGEVEINNVNSVGSGEDGLRLTGTLGIMNNSDTFSGIRIAYTNVDHTGSNNYFYGVNVANIVADPQCEEYAINIGTGWDRAFNTAQDVYFGSTYIATTKHLTVGAVQWDNGSDYIDGEKVADDTIDDDSIDWSDVTIADLSGAQTSGAVAWDLSGATSFELPNGTDPDVDAIGETSVDSDDHVIRGFDGSAQYAAGMKVKQISRTITKPLDLDEDATLCVWKNRTGLTFVITAIYSSSDTDDVNFTLKETAGTDYSSLTTIEAVEIATDGTSVYYNDLTSGIDHTSIESGNDIVFDNDATDDPDYVSFTIVGYFNADVD